MLTAMMESRESRDAVAPKGCHPHRRVSTPSTPEGSWVQAKFPPLPVLHQGQSAAADCRNDLRVDFSGQCSSNAEHVILLQALAFAQLGYCQRDAGADFVTTSEHAADIFGIEPGPRLTWAQKRDLLPEPDREQAREAVEDAIAAAHRPADGKDVRVCGGRWVG